MQLAEMTSPRSAAISAMCTNEMGIANTTERTTE
jgi:hypothetical protein